MTSKQLEDRFAKYGTIVSARVVIDENHRSLRYGFVLFDDEDSADAAKVGEFGSKRMTWSHLSSKPLELYYNASDEVTSDELVEVFEKLGEIKSC